MKINREYSKRFLIAASAYRRQVGKHSAYDFTAVALKAQFDHESLGKPKPDARINGYTLGKFYLSLTHAQMRQDLKDGLFTKHELCSGSCTATRLFIRNLPPSTFFGYRD